MLRQVQEWPPKSEGVALRDPWGKSPGAKTQKVEGTWLDCRCLEDHILQKVHTLPRAALALEILALWPQTFHFQSPQGGGT